MKFLIHPNRTDVIPILKATGIKVETNMFVRNDRIIIIDTEGIEFPDQPEG